MSREVPAKGLALLSAAVIIGSACGSPEALDQSLYWPLGDLGYRPFEARLSHDTGYASCVERPRGSGSGLSDLGLLGLPSVRCSPPPAVGSEDFDRLVRSGGGLPEAGPETHRAAVLSLLRQGSTGSLQEAHSELERAHALDPGDASILSDLAATRFQLALLSGRPDLLLESYEAAQRALEVDPNRREALFNRALVLTRLQLTASARRAWDAYLEVDWSTAWAVEARRRRAGLAGAGPSARWIGGELRRASADGSHGSFEALVRRHRQQAREWAELDLLAAWGSAQLARDHSAAAEILRMGRKVSGVLAGEFDEHMLADGIDAIERPGAGGPDTVDRLARAHRALELGHSRLYEDWDLDGAERSFVSAERGFAACGSSFSYWASFYRGLVATYRNRHAESRALLRRLEAKLPGDRYPVLAGRIAWIEGLTASKMQDLQSSADAYRRAVRIFARLGEEQNLAATQGLLASAESKLGRHEMAWRLTFSALQRRSSLYSPARLHAILEDAVINGQRQGLLRAALVFADEHIAALKPADVGAQMLHNAHMRRGGLLAALGRERAAKEEFRRALALRDWVSSPEIAGRADADRGLEQGRLLVYEDPEAAVRHLSAAIAAYLEAGELQKLPEAYGHRAAAQLRLGKLREAEQDLSERITLLDLARRGLLSELDRGLYVRETTPAFDAMIDLQSAFLGRPDRAFQVAEQARATLFDDWARQAVAAGVDAEALADDFTIDAALVRLPTGTAVLSYAVLEDRLLLWILTHRGLEEHTIEVEEARLTRLVEDLLSGIQAGGDDYRASARRLHRLLIEPAAAQLSGAERLLVVPDKILSALPFEALIDGRSERYLVEDFVLASAPSLSLYMRLTDRAQERDPAGPVLVVGGASGPGAIFPALPGVRQEVDQSASLHSEVKLLDMEGRSVDALLDALRQAVVFHFAGHALPSAEPPHLPLLILDDRQGALLQLSGRDLDSAVSERLRLVVLSACSTARTKDPPDLVTTLARPFLAAGVPAFVGGRWEVDDRATQKLFAAFHRSLALGRDPASSLAHSQRELLAGPDARLRHPRAWAAFTVTGAPFELTAR